MLFQLLPMTEEDIPEFAIVDEAAMAGWSYAQAMWDGKTPRRVMAEKYTRQGWNKNPEQHWNKVVDTESGEIAAVALWTIPAGAAKATQNQEATTPDLPAPVVEVVDPKAVRATGADVVTDEKPKDERPPLMQASAKIWEDFKRDFIGDQPFANLNILVTHPKYQRKGAGSMLVKWGCDRADEQGILSALEASNVGLHVYTKYGFEIKDVVELDLKPYGVDDVELRRAMIRQPKSKEA